MDDAWPPPPPSGDITFEQADFALALDYLRWSAGAAAVGHAIGALRSSESPRAASAATLLLLMGIDHRPQAAG